MKNYLTAFFLLVILSGSFAQSDTTKQNPFNAKVDIVSSFVWRGMDVNMAPNIQPCLTYEKGIFTAGAWGSTAVNGDYNELDLFVTFTKNLFYATITDYYIAPTIGSWNFFDYSKNNTFHAIEGTLGYSGTDKFPLSLNASVFFYGADLKPNGNPYYSTYIEAKYSFKRIDLFCGITPSKGFYHDEFGVVNAGIAYNHGIKINKTFEIPLTLSLVTNPAKQKAILVAAVSF